MDIIKLCVCGSILALLFLCLIMIGVWTMPYRMNTVTPDNKLGLYLQQIY
jgi:hypothetical protein